MYRSFDAHISPRSKLPLQSLVPLERKSHSIEIRGAEASQYPFAFHLTKECIHLLRNAISDVIDPLNEPPGGIPPQHDLDDLKRDFPLVGVRGSVELHLAIGTQAAKTSVARMGIDGRSSTG